MLKAGDQAPELGLASDTGETFTLGDFLGSRVAIFFYPKDDTPG